MLGPNAASRVYFVQYLGAVMFFYDSSLIDSAFHRGQRFSVNNSWFWVAHKTMTVAPPTFRIDSANCTFGCEARK